MPIGVSSAFPTKQSGPGASRLTPPAFAAPQTPWVGLGAAFRAAYVTQIRPPAPPPLTSQRWTHDFTERGRRGRHQRNPDRRADGDCQVLDRQRDSSIQPVGRDVSTTRALDLLQTGAPPGDDLNVVGADQIFGPTAPPGIMVPLLAACHGDWFSVGREPTTAFGPVPG